MTIYLRENFNGSGLLAGTAPEVTLASGLVWQSEASYETAESGGLGFCPNPTDANSLSGASIGDTYSVLGLVGPVRTTFTIKTPPGIGVVGGVSHRGVTISMRHGFTSHSVRVWGYYNGSTLDWYMNMNGGSPYYIITSELQPDTLYTGVWDVADGAQSFMFLGHTLTASVSEPEPSVGLSQVAIVVGGYSKIDFLEVSTNVNGNGDVVTAGTLSANITAPSPSLAASFAGATGRTLSFSGSPPIGSVSASVLGPVAFSFSGSPPLGILGFTMLGANMLSFSGGPSAGQLRAFLGASAKLTAPAPTLSAGATATATLQAALNSPAGALLARAITSAVLNAALAPKMGQIQAFTGAFAKITAPSAPLVAASVTAGGVARVTVMAPLFDLNASASRQNRASAAITAPVGFLAVGAKASIQPPMGMLTAVGSAVFTVTYEAYALNLKHNAESLDELTRYTNFPFDRIVRYQNSYYGMNSTGLYLLEGTTDDGAPIQWEVKTCMTDFSSVFLKTVTAAYFGGRLGAAATVELHVGEAGTLTYSYTTPMGTDAQNYRQVFGKGVKDRYYALGAKGIGAFSLDSVTLSVSELSRRI